MNNKLIILTFILTLSGCGEKEEKNTSAAQPASVDQNAEGEKKEQQSGDFTNLGLTQGLPAYCEAIELKDDQSCYRCTIQDTPIERCIESKKSIDFAKSCSFDDAKFQCKEDEKMVHELSLTSPMELQILNFVPIAVLTARAFVGIKLKDKPEANKVLNNSLDFISSHIRQIVLSERTDELKEDILAFASVQHGIFNKNDEGEPEALPETVATDVGNGTDAVLDFMQRKRLSGNLNLFDGLEIAKELTKAIPSLKLDGALELLDFKSLDITAILTQILTSNQNQNMEKTDP